MALLTLYCTGVATLGGSHCSSVGEMTAVVPFQREMLQSHTLLAFISFLLYLFYCFIYFIASFILFFFPLPKHP